MGFAWIWVFPLLIVLVLRADAPSSSISNLLHLQAVTVFQRMWKRRLYHSPFNMDVMLWALYAAHFLWPIEICPSLKMK
jgi:hypothetical protein